MNSRLRQFTLAGSIAKVISVFAYRRTDVPKATLGHTHHFFSFYLTKGLGLRAKSGETIAATDTQGLTLWIVPPGMFHEWVATEKLGTVWDMTPLHRPHQLAVSNS